MVGHHLFMEDVMKSTFKNDFEDADNVFCAYDVPKEKRDGIEIIFADYTYKGYSGYSQVIFKENGSFYEVHGSHCSCFGLEGQWEPELIETETYRARMDRLGNKEMVEAIQGWF